MNSYNNWKTVLFGSASVISGIAAKITKLVTICQQSDKINDVLFYGAGEGNKIKELGLNNLFCIYYLLIHASRTIDVCVPSLQSETITKCLINIHQKNKIKLRIIVHKNQAANLKSFLNCGIEVKVSSSEMRLEHEFILIDAADKSGEALAIIGSLDYDVKRVNCKRDSTLLVSENAVVFALQREFDRIWNTVMNMEHVVIN